jgi:hypothetical protein
MASLAHGEVFKCIDQQTGKMTLTDRACPDKGTGDAVQVRPTNSDAAYPSADEIAERRAQDEKIVQRRHDEWNQKDDAQKLKERWGREYGRALGAKKSTRSGNESRLCPDGTYVSGTNCNLHPDGTYTGN